MNMRYWVLLGTTDYSPSTDDLSVIGWTEVTKKPEPHPDLYLWDVNIWDWAIDQAQGVKVISALRIENELKGIVFKDIQFPITDAAKVLISNYAIHAQRHPDETYHFTLEDGSFVELTATEVAELHDAIFDHVNRCYKRERELRGLLTEGTLTAELLDEGWYEEVPVDEEPVVE